MICENGHITEIFMRIETAEGFLMYAGRPDDEQVRELLIAMDEGCCPACGIGLMM